MSFQHKRLFDDIPSGKQDVLIINEHFCYIQIPKTGSTSLWEECMRKNLTIELPCFRHEGLDFLENFFDPSLPVYCTVRNPFTHIVSFFFHNCALEHFDIDRSKPIVEEFERFVRLEINNVNLRQIDFIKSTKGIRVNILKFEEDNPFQVLNNKFGLNLEEQTLNVGDYTKDSENIRNFYSNPEIYRLVITHRLLEFLTFGYSLDLNDI